MFAKLTGDRAFARVLIVSVLLAACGSFSQSSAERSLRETTSTAQSSSITTSTFASTTTSKVPTPVTTITPSADVNPARCTFAKLKVIAGRLGAGLGHSGETIDFTNTGSSPCSIYGFPGVAGLDSSGNQVTQAVRTLSGYLGGLTPGNNAFPKVILQTGETASATIEGTDNPVGNQTTCPQLSGILVTPPNTHHFLKFDRAPGYCSRLQVHPVVKGTTGWQSS